MRIVAAADGSALGNPGPAGWAWVIDDGAWRSGGWNHGTNNQGELQAVLDLLESTAAVAAQLVIYCDSKYVIDSLTKWLPGWKRRGWRKADGSPVLNQELLKQLDAALAGRDVRFEWVKGHSGHRLNELADSKARAAAAAYQAGRGKVSGPGFAAHSRQATAPAPSTAATTAPNAAAAPAPSSTAAALALSSSAASATPAVDTVAYTVASLSADIKRLEQELAAVKQRLQELETGDPNALF